MADISLVPTGVNGAGAANPLSLPQMREALKTQANRLGARWHFRRATIVPLEATLARHARSKGITILPGASMLAIGIVYYAMILVLGSAYGLIIGDLQAWEPPVSWVGGAALAIAFWGASMLVWWLWKCAAIATLRADEPRRTIMLALVISMIGLAMDFGASLLLLNAGLRENFLGASTLSAPLVWLLAGVTTLAQVTGTVYGWGLGLRHEAATGWWAEVAEQRANELDAVRRIALAIERRLEEEKLYRRNRRPRGHVAYDSIPK